MNELNDIWIQQGWQCPICKKVMSPTQSYCIFCASQDNKTYVSSGTSIDVDWVKHQTKTFSNNGEKK